MTQYTELLKAAVIRASEEMMQTSDPVQKEEWAMLYLSCRMELWKVNKKIEPLSKKRLDKDS